MNKGQRAKGQRAKDEGRKGESDYKAFNLLPFALRLLPFALCLLFSCEEEVVDYGLGEYFQEIVTSQGDHSYLLDDGELIYDANPGKHKLYDDSTRVFLTYSFTEDKKLSSDQGKAISIHSSSPIAQGNMKTADRKEIEQSPNDPVQLESVWIGSHYLNLRFYMEYKSKTHSIALVCDQADLGKAIIPVYFKHNHNDDPAGYPVYVITSFDLERVLGKAEGNKTLQIHLNTSNYGDKIYELKY